MKNLIKAIVFLVLIALAGLLMGCSSEPPRWKNLIFRVDPNDLSTIKVTDNINNGFTEIENGDDFFIHLETWENEKGEVMHRLQFSGSFEFHSVYWTGHYNIRYDKHGNQIEDGNMEMNFKDKSAYSFIFEGRLKKVPYYDLMLSHDKSK